MKTTIPIAGMTCTNCSLKIEKTLNKMEEVIQAKVDLISETAIIEFNEKQLDIKDITKKIESIGYSVPYINNSIEDEFENIQKEELEKQKRKFWVSLILTIPIMIFGMNWIYMPSSHIETITLNIILFVSTSIVIFYSGIQFLKGFFISVKNLYPDMNTLITIGVISAYIYSTIELIFYTKNLHSEHIHLYFDTSATIITFILLGKYLEKKATYSSSESIKSLLKLRTKKVTLLRDNKELNISAEFINKGDILIIRPGESIPIDGSIIEGNATIDESFLTGEYIPVDKSVGEQLSSGTICISGAVHLKAEKVGNDTYLHSIIELIKKAQLSKPTFQKYIDKISAIFVPIILIIATFTFIYWYFIDTNHELNTSLIRFVTVLIISCPCSLGLATPIATIIAIGVGAKNNIYFRDIDSIERIKDINVLCFDKTGTLTTGEIEVIAYKSFSDISPEELLKITASGEYYSEHPVGKAITKKNKVINDSNYEVSHFNSLTGFGVSFKIDNKNWYVGSFEMLNKTINIPIENIEHDEINLNIYIFDEEKIYGKITLSDIIKPDAKTAINNIKSLNTIKVKIISGDNLKRTKLISELLGIDDFEAGIKPEEKLQIISTLQEKGKIVGMIGDGINDAVALSKADISMAYSSGTDIATNSSHIVFTKNDLNSVYKSLILSGKTMQIIKQNLFWAFFYNIICIPIAAGLLVAWGVVITPSIASVAMTISSITVVGNSQRLKRVKLYVSK
jgi:heavy metal translocating P-type ATPase